MPPISTLKDPYDIPAKELDHFNTYPWASSILKSSLQDGQGDYYPIITWSRVPKLDTGEDGFFAQTLDSPETIPFWLTLRRKDIAAVNSQLPNEPPMTTVIRKSKSSDGNESTSKSYTVPAAPSRPPDTISLITLGAPGVSGHPSTAHGGVVASLFDEVMSIAAALHMPEVSEPEDGPRSRDGKKYYTAQLDTRYKRPMGVPNLVVFKAWVVAQEGRKFWTFAQAVQEEAGDEKHSMALENPKRKTVRAEGFALWVGVDELQTKL